NERVLARWFTGLPAIEALDQELKVPVLQMEGRKRATPSVVLRSRPRPLLLASRRRVGSRAGWSGRRRRWEIAGARGLVTTDSRVPFLGSSNFAAIATAVRPHVRGGDEAESRRYQGPPSSLYLDGGAVAWRRRGVCDRANATSAPERGHEGRSSGCQFISSPNERNHVSRSIVPLDHDVTGEGFTS